MDRSFVNSLLMILLVPFNESPRFCTSRFFSATVDREALFSFETDRKSENGTTCAGRCLVYMMYYPHTWQHFVSQSTEFLFREHDRQQKWVLE